MQKSLTMFVNQTNKTLIPEDMERFLFILGDFESGQMVTVTIEPFVREGSLKQKGLFFKYISLIADYTGMSKEGVKMEMKKQFGPRDENGTLISTTKYSTVDYNKIIEGTRLFAIEELGMQNLPTPEEMKEKNLKDK